MYFSCKDEIVLQLQINHVAMFFLIFFFQDTMAKATFT